MGAQSARKRLIIALLALTVILAGASAWLIDQNSRPFEVRKVAGVSLFVPDQFLGPRPNDLVNLVKAYIKNQSGQHRFQSPAADLLPESTRLTITDAESTVIWTVSAAKENTAAQSIMMPSSRKLLEAIASGGGPKTEDAGHGLIKIQTHENDSDAFSFSNFKLGSGDGNIEGAWLAHCIRFRALREGNSWGRCSRQLFQGNLLISIHYDGLLVRHSGIIGDAIVAQTLAWQTEPTIQ